MKLYKISQSIVDGYDTYDAAIVCAHDLDDAKKIHPSANAPLDWWLSVQADYVERTTWVYSIEYASALRFVKVEYIGEAVEGAKRGVILASFNAV